MKWQGVIPAMTTAFDAALQVDYVQTVRHALRLVESGCTGLVLFGSLGEGATLTAAEKIEILKQVHSAVNGRAPVVATVSALSTADAVALARNAEQAGCDALMILPPYAYQGDWREMKQHVGEILSATTLSCMLYNNPIAYGTDFLPEQIRELAESHANLNAIKESSADVRRISAIRALLDDRLALLVGVDDAIVEAAGAGAVGWIAGLVNAFPIESVKLFEFARDRMWKEAFALYRWFLPLLRMDTVPKFVQLIKLAQELLGMGSSRVRPPRLPLTGSELEAASRTIKEALQTRPAL